MQSLLECGNIPSNMKDLIRHTIFTTLFLSLFILTGYLIWSASSLSENGGLKSLFPLIWLSGIFLGFLTFYVVFCFLNHKKTISQYLFYDSLTILSLPLFLIVETSWKGIGNWWFAFGNFCIFLILVKSFISFRFLYYEKEPDSHKSLIPVFLLTFMIYLLITPWMQFYLLRESLWKFSIRILTLSIITGLLVYTGFLLIKKTLLNKKVAYLLYPLLIFNPIILLLVTCRKGTIILFLFLIILLLFFKLSKPDILKSKIVTSPLFLWSYITIATIFILISFPIILISGWHSQGIVSILPWELIFKCTITFVISFLLLGFILKKLKRINTPAMVYLIVLTLSITTYPIIMDKNRPETLKPLIKLSIPDKAIQILEKPLTLSSSNNRFNIEIDKPLKGVNQINIISNLSYSSYLTQGEEVIQIKVFNIEGNEETLNLRAGIETSEWCIECKDIKRIIQHKKAEIAQSWYVNSPYNPTFRGYTYKTEFHLSKINQIKNIQLIYVLKDKGVEVNIYEIYAEKL